MRSTAKSSSRSAYRRQRHEPDASAPPKEPFTLEIDDVVNPKANTALQGIYLSRGVYCSQCEAQGFRRITYFLDRPDVLAEYTVRLEADIETAPVLLANGNPVERGTLSGGERHYAVWHDPHPKPSYLFAIVGGDLSPVASTFTTQSGREVDLSIYVEHGKEAARALGDGIAEARDAVGRGPASAANTISTFSTSSPSRISTWGPWRTRASTSSTIA